MRVEVEIESSSRPGVIHKVWLGDPPTCSCEAFQYGYRICRHIRQARIRVYKEQKGKPDSAFRSIATAPTESPEPHKDDSLRNAFEGMGLQERVDAIERMAKRIGV